MKTTTSNFFRHSLQRKIQKYNFSKVLPTLSVNQNLGLRSETVGKTQKFFNSYEDFKC